ncbi:toluene hydroxylase [Rhodobacter sphaeroides]|uniref:Monooxygenase beta subunit n=2 Tax=Cereibacter sphaeroides TaxID=1063 RepID=Q3J2G3_CERS4|nr:aromatic/alkene monooxygenase hydroxylase subunit beta [Cereibacter sphaeroides]ABN76616.1 methane/phenol/toluene hydroxylase [Cereibacter sphaeroides ATCC 17029]EKX59007.1 Methane monooxygenase component A beta chain [Rhodobacter sp. AKP1]ABA79021.1 Putative monooxygenase beta subunit [Cereibacter sphaeroides 2.4.1]AMJ47341.1 toluene hydroxylase [Cereibacter sphaeroides]ANS34054.1 toluene hydroxylase [Cereibacter sphaeroides]
MPAVSSSVGSGAAGAAIFAGSASRRYNYFEPRGKRATHYEDVTCDVQPDPERYLIQDWIISFNNGKGAYTKDNTRALSSNWHAFRAPDQEWERTHYQRQSKIETMVQSVIANARKAGAPRAFDRAWIKILQTHLGAWKHAEFGLGTSLMQAQRYGYTQMINNATLTNASYKMRLAQDITLYLAEIGMDIDGWDDEAGKRAWLEDPVWQPCREAVETIMGAEDYLEQYFAINLIFEPLVGELFRSGFLMQAAAANNDFITPPVISAAEADYERNLANTIDLMYLLATDNQHAEANRALMTAWIGKHATLADKAAAALQPIWSQPHSKPVSFEDVRAVSHERVGRILGELGLSR